MLWPEEGPFKEMATLAMDRVCGIVVARARSISTDVAGGAFCFCSPGCGSEFLREVQ